jgi:hypothetical protein
VHVLSDFDAAGDLVGHAQDADCDGVAEDYCSE